MVRAPLNIRRFELLQFVSFFVGVVGTLVDGTLVGNIVRAAGGNLVGAARGKALGAAIGAAIGSVAGLAIFIALTLLVSRRRKNWARWALLIFQMFGFVFALWQGVSQAIFSQPYALVTALSWLIQAVALVLVFTPQSGQWLRGDQSQDLRHALQ